MYMWLILIGVINYLTWSLVFKKDELMVGYVLINWWKDNMDSFEW